MIKLRYKEYPNGEWQDWSQYLVTPPTLSKKIESERPGEAGIITFDSASLSLYCAEGNPVDAAFNRDLTAVQRYLFEVSCPNSLGVQIKLFEGVADFSTIEQPDLSNELHVDLIDKLSALAVLAANKEQLERFSAYPYVGIGQYNINNCLTDFASITKNDQNWVQIVTVDPVNSQVINHQQPILRPGEIFVIWDIINQKERFHLVLKSELGSTVGFSGIAQTTHLKLYPSDISYLGEYSTLTTPKAMDFYRMDYYGLGDIGIYNTSDELTSFNGLKIIELLVKQQWPEINVINKTGQQSFHLPLEYYDQFVGTNPFNTDPLGALQTLADSLLCYAYIDRSGNFVIQSRQNLTPLGTQRNLGATTKVDGSKKYFWDKLVDGVDVRVKSWVYENDELVFGEASIAKSIPGSTMAVKPRNSISKEILAPASNLTTKGALDAYAASIASEYMAFYGVRHSSVPITLDLDDNVLQWEMLDYVNLDSGDHFFVQMDYDLVHRTVQLELISIAGSDYYPGQVVVPNKNAATSASSSSHSSSSSGSVLPSGGDPYQWSGTPIGLNAVLARQSLGLQDTSNLGSGLVSTSNFNHLQGLTGNIQGHFNNTLNPHNTTKAQVGLSNVDNVKQEPFINPGTTSQFFRGDKSWVTPTTDMVTEGAAKYFTDARARAAISVTDPLLYSNATGVLGLNISGNLKITAGQLDTIQGITPTSDPQFRDLQVRNLTVTNLISAAGTEINGTASQIFVIGSQTTTPDTEFTLQFGQNTGNWVKWSDATDTFVISNHLIVTGTTVMTGASTLASTLSVGGLITALSGISATGNISVTGNVTGANINASNWDAAYTHSQALHVGLTGANASGTWNINISGEADSAKNGLTTLTSFGSNPLSDVFGSWDNLVVRDDSHLHDGRYYTETEIQTSYYNKTAIDGMFSATGGIYEPKLPAAPETDPANKFLNAQKQWAYPNVNTMTGYDNLLTKSTQFIGGLVSGTWNNLQIVYNAVNFKVTQGLGFDTIQDIHSGASPTFAGMTIGAQPVTGILITNWNTAYSNNHTHANKSYLDTINQNMGTSHAVTFAGMTINGDLNVNSANKIIMGEHQISRYNSTWLRLNTNMIIAGITETSNIQLYNNFWAINKAGNGWLKIAYRNTSGTEAVYDLDNIGSLNSNSIINSKTIYITTNGDGVKFHGMTNTAKGGVFGSGNIIYVGSWDDAVGRFQVDAVTGNSFITGNLTLGRTGTSGALYLRRASDATASVALQNGGSSFTLTQSGGIGSIFTMDSTGILFQTEDSTAPYSKVTRMQIMHGDNATVYIVNKLGVGTATPTGRLTVYKSESDTADFANANLLLEGSSSTNNRWGFRIDTSGNLSIDSVWSAAVGSKMFFSRNGNIGLGTTTVTAGKVVISNGSTLNQGAFVVDQLHASAEILDLRKSGLSVFRVLNGGNLVHYGSKSFSNNFTSGWIGAGFQLDYGVTTASKSTLEIDNLTVRGRMSVYELLVKEYKGTGGNQVITAATGKVASVSGNQITLENPDSSIACPFAVNDLIEAQVFNQAGGSVRLVQATVTAVNGFTLTLSYTAGTFQKGDNIYQTGNSMDSSRQAMFYFAVTDSNSPYMRILDGINSFASRSDTAKIKAQIGNLASITSTNFGALTGLAGAYLPVLIAEGTVKIAGELYASVGGFGNTVAQPVVKISTPGLYVQNYGTTQNVTGNGSYIGNWQSTTGFNGTILNHNGLYGYANNTEIFRIGATSQLAGFTFDNQKLSAASGSLAMDSNLKHFIAASNTSTDYVKLYFTGNNDWGIKGVQGNQVKFQLGYVNTIAGWTFDTEAIFTGTKVVASGFAAANGDFTISKTIGISTKNFYVDLNGNAGFSTTSAATGTAGISIYNGAIYAFDDHASATVFDTTSMNYGSLQIRRQEYVNYYWVDQAAAVLDRTGLFISTFTFPGNIQTQSGYSYVGHSSHGVTEYTVNYTKSAHMSPSAISISNTPAGGSAETATLTPADLTIGTRSIMNSIGNLENVLSPGAGITGSFTTVDNKTIWVTDGIVTAIDNN